MISLSQIIGPGGCALVQSAGKYLSIKTCTLPLQVSLGGGAVKTCGAGTVLPADDLSHGFNNVNFVNPNAQPVTVVFFIGETPVQYAPGDNSQSIQDTYAKGNLGFATIDDIDSFFGYQLRGAIGVGSAGVGFQKNDIVYLNIIGITNTPAQFLVRNVNASGGIAQLQLQNPGNYSAAPTSPGQLSGGSGTGATATFTGTSSTPPGGLAFSTTVTGFMQMSSQTGLIIPNLDGGNKRKYITFSVSAAGSGTKANLLVQDANGNTFGTIFASSIVGFETGSTFYVMPDSASGIVTFAIGEIYYST